MQFDFVLWNTARQRRKKRAELIQFSKREASLPPKRLERQLSSIGGPTIVRESLGDGELFAKL